MSPRTSSAADTSRLILLGVITQAHGIRGEIKLKSYTAEPEDITAYGPLRDKSGTLIALTLTGGTKDSLIAKIKGIETRDAAEKLRNTELFVPRNALPPPRENEYYHEDLVGLNILTEKGEAYGNILAMHNFGAGDLASIKRITGEEELLPFTRKTFLKIDFENSLCIIRPPEMIGQ